jgi:Tfp pilus assembly protein PilO
MSSSARTIVAAVLVAAAAIAFWTLALSPARKEADTLSSQVETLESSVDVARGELAQATAAKHSFPTAYHQLVEMGQAVPATDETPSLLVELETLAGDSEVEFESIQLESTGEEVAATVPEITAAPEVGSSTAVPASEVIPATEVEAALLPLGSSIGTAGLAVMPYKLSFNGSFFGIAKFIGKVDALVESGKADQMTINGRLVTIGGFLLATDVGEEEEGSNESGSSNLTATFSVTTYLTPPGQGITAGASPSTPAEASSETVAAE